MAQIHVKAVGDEDGAMHERDDSQSRFDLSKASAASFLSIAMHNRILYSTSEINRSATDTSKSGGAFR